MNNNDGFSTFEDWLEFTDLEAAKRFAEPLKRMCVSDETFRFDRDLSGVVELITADGAIPRLAAADIVHSAQRYFKKQHELASAPLAVFWDAENMHLPAGLSGLEFADSLRSTLAPFGILTKFTCYLDVSGNSVPHDKRSELHLSGCHVIDTPHRNRKEVADKMIIVDALLFVMDNLERGATLCFITGDHDYAYMLSRIKEFPKFRTICCVPATDACA